LAQLRATAADCGWVASSAGGVGGVGVETGGVPPHVAETITMGAAMPVFSQADQYKC
jgi:hypothetical protein